MARFNGGWIKIHRSILDHPVSQRGLFTFGIFIRLLYMANWKESSVIFGGKKITLKPGQLVTGLRELSIDSDEDPYLNRVRASLDYLVLCEAIEQVSNNQGRLITICNWDKYQNTDECGLSMSTSEAQQAHRQATSEPQLSEEGKKEEGKKLAPKPERSQAYGAISDLRGDSVIEEILNNVSQESQRNWLSLFDDKEWIRRELLKARGHLLANPKKTPKSRRGWATYLTAWLNRGWEWQRRLATSQANTINTKPLSAEELT